MDGIRANGLLSTARTKEARSTDLQPRTVRGGEPWRTGLIGSHQRRAHGQIQHRAVLNNGWDVDDVLRNHDKIQRAAALIGRTRDSLRHVKRIKEFSHANGIRVEWVHDVHIEITANDERSAE